jgi:hypothetical protein
MSKSRLITIGATLVTLAVIYRVPQAKDMLTGDDKFLGIF